MLDEVDLASLGLAWVQDQLYALAISCAGPQVTVTMDGQQILQGQDEVLGCGGAGFMFENGIMGARDIRCFELSDK